VVLLMGCDKTTPSLLMGASSVDLPTIGVSGGPMLSGWYKGERIGSGTNTWSLSEDLRAARSPRTNSTRPRAACTARTATA
jgi:dihydroxy-acid dehydratase